MRNPESPRSTGSRTVKAKLEKRGKPRVDWSEDALPQLDKTVRDELTLTATKQITIRCGASSITLTAEGKIILRGKYIVSRSSGVQRIKGGSVQIN